MSKVKKILAVVLSMAMIMGMSITSFAANPTPATINGVEAEEGATIRVLGYQIIKYNVVGKYEPVIAGTIDTDDDGNLKPTAANIQALASRTAELGTPVEFVKQEDGSYTSTELLAGSYLVVVNGASNYVYNPSIISVQQGADGLEPGTLNLNANWENSTYVKKSEPTITKKAVTPNVQGVQYGDVIEYQITATVPSYPTNKSDIEYTISDVLTGLQLVVDADHPVTVTGAGSFEATIKNAVVNEATSITAALTGDDAIRTIGGNTITINYFAKVTTAAKINVDKANNKATLDYSTADGTGSKDSETNHYTFGIGTTINGTYGDTTINKTGEFIKTSKNGTIEYVENATDIIKNNGTSILSGAEFQLHIGSATGATFADATGATTFTTTADGRLEINGLDSDITYYLVETKAPTGYTINATPVPVKITATFDEKGILTGYTVNINNAVTNYGYKDNGTVAGETTLINTAETPSNPYQFKNDTLSSLPSTGGIGTTIFTIGGCAIMIIAAFLYFRSRKKSQQ